MSIKPLSTSPRKSSLGIFSTGLALFSMFFGAGNLIFPLIIGQVSGNQAPFAMGGLALSAVAFPFLGLIAMMFYGGKIHDFLGRLGKGPALILLFVLQMSQGPVGGMPRLITLMYASIKPYVAHLPGATLFLFSLMICALIFVLTVRPQKIIHLLGVVLTPFLLLTLAILVIVGMIHAPEAPSLGGSALSHFNLGLKMGYQTTDLIAALLFATIVLPHLSHGTEHLSPEEKKGEINRRMKGASLVASLLLMISYIGLCYLSAHHSGTFNSLPPEELLHAISVQILGPVGGWIAGAAVFLACLTTAISLAAVFSEYLRTDVLPKTLAPIWPLVITLGVTAGVANLGFGGIIRLWGPLLEILYPSLIVLCLMNIAHCLYRFQSVQTPVFFTLGVAIGGLYF